MAGTGRMVTGSAPRLLQDGSKKQKKKRPFDIFSEQLDKAVKIIQQSKKDKDKGKGK